MLRVSYCVKYAGTGFSKLMGIKKRRLLFLTSAGRVIYADPKTQKQKGDFRLNLQVQDSFGVDYIDRSNFEFIADKRKYKFSDTFLDSEGWVTMTKAFLMLLHAENPILANKGAEELNIPPLSMNTVLFSNTIDPLFAYLKQGLLYKSGDSNKNNKNNKSNKSNKKNKKNTQVWDKRWFILHGVNLYWFPQVLAVGTKPRGKVILNSESEIKSSADRDFCLKLITPLFPEGILLAASSNQDKKLWMRAIQRAIQRTIVFDRKVRKNIYVSATEGEDASFGYDSGDEEGDDNGGSKKAVEVTL